MTEINSNSDNSVSVEAPPLEIKPNGELALRLVMLDDQDNKNNEESAGRVSKRRAMMNDNFKWWMLDNNSGLQHVRKLAEMIEELNYKQPSTPEENKSWRRNPTAQRVNSKYFRKVCANRFIKRSRKKRSIARLAKLGLLPMETSKLRPEVSKNGYAYYYSDC